MGWVEPIPAVEVQGTPWTGGQSNPTSACLWIVGGGLILSICLSILSKLYTITEFFVLHFVQRSSGSVTANSAKLLPESGTFSTGVVDLFERRVHLTALLTTV